MPQTQVDWNYYWDLGFQTVKELETDKGILASGKNEVYGCIFGRDSLITSLKLLRVYQQTKTSDFLNVVRKVLLTLTELQGKEVNIESGEQPGKCIHEFRPDRHEHLTQATLERPWFLYPDKVMRNYDTVDATPLLLITLYRYHQLSQDSTFLRRVMPNVKDALNWILIYGDSNNDGFIDYGLHPDRRYGGLQNQNWMDSGEATFHEDGQPIQYPVAPVEAQAYAYMALRLWGNFFHRRDRQLSQKLYARADKLKELFNAAYVITSGQSVYLASAIDGGGNPLKNVRSSMGHVFWAALNQKDDHQLDGILYHQFVDDVVRRLMAPDIFEPEAGIRTLSSLSSRYVPNSYHNGSIWPHDNSMIAEGLENYGYRKEAQLVRNAILKAISHFKTPIEMFVYDQDGYNEFSEKVNGPTLGQKANRVQAWSAAAILRSVTPEYIEQPMEKLPYRLVGFKLKHAILLSMVTDKLKLNGSFHLKNAQINEILKMVSQIKALNVIENLRKKGLISYKEDVPAKRKTSLSLGILEKEHMKSMLNNLKQKLSL